MDWESVFAFGFLTLIVAAFLGLFALGGYGMYRTEMACIERGGTYAGGVCLFHVTADPQSK